MNLGILIGGALAAALSMGALPGAAQTPVQTFAGDYDGSISGALSGSMTFKVAPDGKLAGDANGTIDGRAFEGKIGGAIGGGTGIPFNATVSGTLKAKPGSGGGDASGTFPAEPFNGLQVTYSVTGIKAGAFTDRGGFTNSRTYQVEGASGPVTLTGSAAASKALCNSEYGSFWFQTDVGLTVGGKTQTFRTPEPCTRSGAQYEVQQAAPAFNLSLPAPTGADASVSFSISQTYVNPRFGNRGVVVSGGKAAVGDEKLSLALTGKLTQEPTAENPNVVFAGTYGGKLGDKDIKGDWQARGSASCDERTAKGKRPAHCLPTDLKVCPSAQGGFASTGLIAGADGARAVLRYHGRPNAKIKVMVTDSIKLEDTATDFKIAALPMERVEVSYASDVPAQFTTDANGDLRALLFFRAINDGYKPNQALGGPAPAKVTFTDIEKRSEAAVTVQVGLGIELEHKMAAEQDPVESGPHHTWRAYAKSRFHAGLDLATYVERIKDCDAPITAPIVNVQSVWLNEDDQGTPLNDGIGGPGTAGTNAAGSDDWRSHGQNFAIALSKTGKPYLTVPPAIRRNDHPFLTVRGDDVPGISHLRDGHFIKAYWAYVGMGEMAYGGRDSTGYSGRFLGSAGTIEPRVIDKAVFVLSKDDPEKWYASALCVLEPRDGYQLAWMMWSKMIPGFGQGLEVFDKTVGSLCVMARGDIKGGLTKMAWEMGKFVFIEKVKGKIIPQTAYNLTKGNCPPAVYRLVGVNPTDPKRMSHAFTKWKEVMEMEVDAVIEQMEQSNWQPPAAGSVPSVSAPPPPTVAVPAAPRPAPPGQWNSIGGGDGGGRVPPSAAPAAPATAAPPPPARGGGAQPLW